MESTKMKYVKGISLSIILLQLGVLGFNISRWNEIIGAIFSIVISILVYLPTIIQETREKWFMGLYGFLLLFDFIFQLVNMILLICFQWVAIQYCIYLNVSVDISEYGGVSCNDWWRFGYWDINYRDRALIVTILLAFVVLLRVIQSVLSFATIRGVRSIN